jgi:hypothetical protein
MTFFRFLVIVVAGLLVYVYGWPFIKSKIDENKAVTTAENPSAPAGTSPTEPSAAARPTPANAATATTTPATRLRVFKAGEAAKLKRATTVHLTHGQMVANSGQPVTIQQIKGNTARISVFGSAVDVPITDLE